MRRLPVAGKTGGMHGPVLAKRADIQGLRALAVGLVILGHFGVPGLSGGFIGVDVFFVVSGFLITSLLLSEARSSGRVRVPAFYARRARRILPAATMVLLSTTVYAAYMLPTTRAERIADDATWCAFFGANLHFGREGTDYFTAGGDPSPLEHYWSLAVEEQFYLVWPTVLAALVLLLKVRARWALAAVVAAACLASFTYSMVLAEQTPLAAYFATGARVWELGAGALLALAAPVVGRTPTWLRHALMAGGFAAIAVAASAFDDVTYDPVQTLVAVLGTAALLAAGTGVEVMGANRVLALRPVQWVGDASYSLYLWHWPVLVMGTAHFGTPTAAERTTLVGLAVLMATLSYYLVEMPFRRGSGFWNSPRRALTLWPVAVGTTLIGTMWAGQLATAQLAEKERESAAYYSDPAREPPAHGSSRLRPVSVESRIEESLRLADVGAPIPFPLTNFRGLDEDNWERHYCHANLEETSNEGCVLGARSATLTVAAVGDSHMGMWLPSLDILGKSHGFRVVVFVKYACPPFDVPVQVAGQPYPSCETFREWTRARLRRLDPDVVLLSSYGLIYGASDAGVWEDAVSRAATELQEGGALVEVLSDLTTLPQDPGDCVTDRDSDMSSCVFAESLLTIRANEMFRRAARQSGAGFVDLTSLVCRRHRCPLVVERTLTYRDDDHISVTWAKRIAPEFGHLARLH
jgi:peptidoglycan/LPS O-acetylase OafA/YrhL